jgi:pyridoxamine 5'-phosphate oxidase
VTEPIAVREDYETPPLEAADLDADPLRQLERWLREALDRGIAEPNAMTVCTVRADGTPNARIQLLRGIDARGLSFFGNYESQKGRELDATPHATLVFFWQPLHRQVRVSGPVERLAAEASDAYFATRPRGSQVGAWASPQSRPLASRDELDALVTAAEARFAGVEQVPRPPHWGGWAVLPREVEFWQGGQSRLHDRLRYRRDGDGPWVVERLAP